MFSLTTTKVLSHFTKLIIPCYHLNSVHNQISLIVSDIFVSPPQNAYQLQRENSDFIVEKPVRHHGSQVIKV